MDEESLLSLQEEIAELEKKLDEKKQELEEAQKNHIQAAIVKHTTEIENPIELQLDKTSLTFPSEINNSSSPEIKISLFRSLFKGREDIYAKRFESKKTGKSGYQPVCSNEWVRGVCEKPKINCSKCTKRLFEPVTNEVIRFHLEGYKPSKNEWEKTIPFVMGIYPLLQNETCHFLAIDFDKSAWREDVIAFMNTCKTENIPAALERSRSGNGAHVWIFFNEPVPAIKARKLGSFLMTRTLDQRPEIGLDSFDRFFPNQDTMPKGGFGNLIALPLQKAAREKNHSIFLDENLNPYSDQWAFLSSVKKVNTEKLNTIIQDASLRQELLPVSFSANEDEDEYKPWQKQSNVLPDITELLPQTIEIVLADQLYINHTGLPAILRNRILRLASFANPEFYRSQKLRLPTLNKPHILCCYGFFTEYIGLPAGCLDGLLEILEHYKIKPIFTNRQNQGKIIDVSFIGELYDEQKKAAKKLMENETGILSASTAFGKTILALWIIAQRKVNTIILVHRKILADQWAERINQFLGIPKKDIGIYCGAKKKLTGIIDIAVMQSMVKREKVVDWISDYGQVIVDECHHISASSFERIIRKCPARYRLGLSATVIRKDGQHPIVMMNLGDVRYSDNRKNTIKSFSQKVLTRFTDFILPIDINYEKIEINDIYRELWSNENRNKLIIQDILKAHLDGRVFRNEVSSVCLVLSERLQHLDILKFALQGQIQHLFILKGGMGKKQIKAIMDEIQNVPEDKQRIILSTGKYLGEGFDLPFLDTLFLVFPFSWKGSLTQYTGRLNRVFHGKKEIHVYDYIDEKVPVLARMYQKRLKGYKALGFIVH